MNPLDIIFGALKALSMNKGRSTLTILGIVVGIASVITLVAVGQGVSASITSQISSLGSNLVSVSFNNSASSSSTSSSTSSSSTGSTTTTTTTTDYELTDEDVSALESLYFVEAVAPVTSATFDVVYEGTTKSYSVLGVTPDYATVNSVTIAEGSFITDYVNEKRAHVAVIGSDVASALFDSVNPVGKTVTIDGASYYIIGVTQQKGSGTTTSSLDSRIYIPLDTARRSLIGNSISSLSLTVNNVSDTSSGTSAMNLNENIIKQTIATLHGINTSDSSSSSIIQVTSQSDLLSTVSGVSDTLTMFLAAIAGISLLVGGIGVMNMMLTSVTERIAEIGLRKAVGATPGSITAQFLVEAVMLTVMGGIVGIFIGWAASAAVTKFASITTEVTFSSVLLAVGVCAGIGLVFGIFPARRGGRLDPIVALRYQ